MTTRDAAAKKMTEEQVEECFVIMPISDPEGYSPGHFRHVFDDIFVPACEKAGYRPIRADQVVQTNLIQLDVLRRIVESPMVLCDLSNRNPNVLFELGLRQAFDKPVVLVQELGTLSIFDIAQFRYYEYRPELVYHEVIEDQTRIMRALLATKEAARTRKDVNSIVRLLELTQPASLQDAKDLKQDPAMQLIMSELRRLRAEIQPSHSSARSAPNQIQFEIMGSKVEDLHVAIRASSGVLIDERLLFRQLRTDLEAGLSRDESLTRIATMYNVSIEEARLIAEATAERHWGDLTISEWAWFLPDS